MNNTWFSISTTRGDFIVRSPWDNVHTVEEFIIATEALTFIKVERPISPKATPRVLKICQKCPLSEAMSEDEEEMIMAGEQITCSKCNGSVTPYPDSSVMKITYTTIGSLYDGNHMAIGVNQISTVSVVASDVNDMNQIQDELYTEQEETVKVIV